MHIPISQIQRNSFIILVWFCLSVLLVACTKVGPVETEPVPENTLPATQAPTPVSETTPTTVESTAPGMILTPTEPDAATEIAPFVANPASTNPPLTGTVPPVAASPTSTRTSTATVVPATGTPRPPAEPIFGIELHAISEPGGLNQFISSGAHWVRRNALLWSDVEYLQGTRNWQNLARLETELRNAAEHDLQTILIVRSTPHFARKIASSACGPVAAEDFNAFADFMVEAVSRYSQPPFNVRYWEIGNEPDIDPSQVRSDSVYGCWGDKTDPYYGGGHYAEMLKVVYPLVKAANPQAQLLVGGLLLDCDPTNPPESPPGSGKLKDCSSGRFLEGILESGGGAYFDGVSFHAYDYYGEGQGRYGNLNWHSTWNTTGPVLFAKVETLNKLLARYGWSDKPLLNTEVALICASSPGLCASEGFQLTKAYYAAQVNASALAAGVKANLWYSLQGWRDSELVGSGNTPNLAYTAYTASIERLNGAAYAGPLQLESGLMGVAYNRQGVSGWIVWAVDGIVHRLGFPQTPDQVFDVFGEVLDEANPADIGVAPVYLEWQP